jgi:hypothetical protein
MIKKTQEDLSPDEILGIKERIASIRAEADRLEKLAEALESDAGVPA